MKCVAVCSASSDFGDARDGDAADSDGKDEHDSGEQDGKGDGAGRVGGGGTRFVSIKDVFMDIGRLVRTDMTASPDTRWVLCTTYEGHNIHL